MILSFDQIIALWTKAGGNPLYAEVAARIALAESEGHTDALHHDADGTVDRGLFQINSVHGIESSFDPLVNTRAAIRISRNGTNWSPWAVARQVLGGSMASLAHNLHVRMDEVHKCWPTVTIYWLGDAAHMAEHSDHNPDAIGRVHAIDVMFPVGAKATAVVNWCRAHPGDLEYIIHNRLIYTRGNGFRPTAYSGSDPHTNHVHISGKHGSAHPSRYTGTGYDLVAEESTPAGTPCGTTPPPPAPAPSKYAPGSRSIREGMAGDDVLFAQKFIGSHCGKLDGVFGPDTTAGVKWYQDMRGLTVDGIVGPKTWANMGVKVTF